MPARSRSPRGAKSRARSSSRTAARGRASRTATRRTELRFSADCDPGIRRVRCGRGFRYLHPDGRPVRSAPLLARIRQLAIPPAYRDVWICSDPRGHLQATGRDARGRKQYRYHPQWRTRRDADKFGRMTEFGAALPRLRRRLRRDLRRAGLPREKVLALVVTLLDLTLARVGNAEYARENRSYGLTTLRKSHVRSEGDHAAIVFRGKGGRQRCLSVENPRLVQLLLRLQDLPGRRLFKYLDGDGRRHPLDSTNVNDYLRQAMGTDEGYTAKDFRTWGATVLAVSHLAGIPQPQSRQAARRGRAATARAVAESLGNTAAVTRKSYINPLVFTAWERGLLGDAPVRSGASPRVMERLTLELLRATSA